MKSFSFLMIGMTLLSAISAFASTDVWIYTGTDDKVATAQLAEFLKNHGVSVLKQQEKAVVIQAEDLKMFLQPKMSESGLDRIVAQFFFGVEEAYQSSIELLNFVNMLNQKYNLGGFYIDEDGDFAFQTHLTFIDSLPWVQLEAFIHWIENSFQMVVLLHIEEFMTYLK